MVKERKLRREGAAAEVAGGLLSLGGLGGGGGEGFVRGDRKTDGI